MGRVSQEFCGGAQEMRGDSLVDKMLDRATHLYMDRRRSHFCNNMVGHSTLDDTGIAGILDEGMAALELGMADSFSIILACQSISFQIIEFTSSFALFNPLSAL